MNDIAPGDLCVFDGFRPCVVVDQYTPAPGVDMGRIWTILLDEEFVCCWESSLMKVT